MHSHKQNVKLDKEIQIIDIGCSLNCKQIKLVLKIPDQLLHTSRWDAYQLMRKYQLHERRYSQSQFSFGVKLRARMRFMSQVTGYTNTRNEPKW